MSQGRVHSFHIGKRNEHAEKVHPMTPERLARLQEAEKATRTKQILKTPLHGP